MPYGTLNTGTITPGSGNTLTINEIVDGTAIKDQDNMSSNSATHLATQQSIKAYVDTAGTNSSITTLGTVSAGNLSNTAIVYPAGHVVQVKSVITDFQQTVATASGVVKTTLAGTITPKLLNSAMTISAYFVTYSATDSTAAFDLYRNSGDLTETYNLSGDTEKGLSIQGHPASSTWQNASFFWYDDTSAMTTRNGVQNIEYAVSAWTSAGSVYISNNSKTALVIMEVAV